MSSEEHPGAKPKHTGESPATKRARRKETKPRMKSRKCDFGGCDSPAKFVIRTFVELGLNRVPTRCKQHAPRVDYFEYRSNLCEDPKCSQLRTFGLPNDAIVRWCNRHRQPGAIDLINKKCEYGCGRHSVFGLESEQKARWCALHGRPRGAIDIISRRCEMPGCGIHPSYGIEAEGITRWCKMHGAPHGAIHIGSRQCEEPGCRIQPVYGIEAEGTARWCAAHGERHDAVDIVSRRCEEPGCRIRPNYGFEAEGAARWCAAHGERHGAVDIVTRRCEETDCRIKPSYGFEVEGTARWCAAHGKKHSAVNVVDKMCENCGITSANPKYSDMCFPCFCFKHPDHELVRNFKNKELAVKEFLQASFGHRLDIVHDRSPLATLFAVEEGQASVECRSTRRRPDFMFDLGAWVVIVEVDEHQHKSNAPECEERRMTEIFSVVGRPVVFIRFNPDDYLDADGNTVESPWKTNPINHRTEVPARCTDAWERRLARLRDSVEFNVATPPTKDITVDTLFYDFV